MARLIDRLIFVGAGKSPSFDYYFASRLELHAGPALEFYDLDASIGEIDKVKWRGAFVIFCRYASRRWIRAIKQQADELAGIGLFLDDDIEALVAFDGIGLAYKFRLWRRALRHWPTLLPMLTALWVSTPVLAQRWRSMSPRLLPPIAGAYDLCEAPAPNPEPLVALHSSASHVSDQRWLEPVVRGVLAEDREICFEVVADHAQARRWRGDPRVRVIGAQSWTTYRAETAANGRHLLLAPLLPSRPNAARAAVKRIDATRCGAALLVSDPRVYQVSDEEAALGMVAPLNERGWINSIIGLARDDGRRESLKCLNRRALLKARQAARPLFEWEENGAGGAWRLTE